MAEDALRSADTPEGPTAAADRLDSWKQIAAYLKRDVTTVRRWEKREGLPVHRHLHERRDSVYAQTSELDAWWEGRRSQLAGNGAPPSRTASRASLWRVTAASVLVVAAVLFLTVAVRLTRTAADDPGELRFSIEPPAGTSFGTLNISPDGRLLAFTATSLSGTTLLWIRPLDTLDARPVNGTDGATLPFWSPDSSALGFFAGGKLRIVGVSGGTPHVVCDAPQGRGGTWNRDGTIVFAPGREGGLFRVSAAGGGITPVSTVDRPGERGHMWPEFLPDGHHFLYLADSAEPEHHNLFVGALDGSTPRRLIGLASNAVYANPGYLLFAHDRELVAQAFDAGQLTFRGEPVTIAEQVRQAWDGDHKTDVSVSANGLLVFRSMRGLETQLVWRDRSGRATRFLEKTDLYYEPTLSPDRQLVAMDVFDPRSSKVSGFGVAGVTSDIWLVHTRTGAASRFTFDPAADFDPVWSPDGNRIAFSSNRGGVLDLYAKDAAGGSEELVFASQQAKHAQAWSPDGRFLVFGMYDPQTHVDVWLLPMTGERAPVALLRTPASEHSVAISPDGRWFAYTSNVSGRPEVYVQSFPSPAGKWQISKDGGGDPRWRPDGRELFYISADRRLMAVAVQTTGSFEASVPMPLFDTGMDPDWGKARNHYDVGTDGQQFLMMTPVADDRSSPFTLVVNWLAGIRSRIRPINPPS